MTGVGRAGTLAVALAFLLLSAVPAGGAAVGLGDASVSPTSVSTGETTTLDLSVNATGVNTTDGTTGANVTVAVPAALDLSDATVTAEGATPNATGVGAVVDDAANAVVVSWDDDAGADAETVTVTATVSGVAVDRTGEYDLTATVDADGDGATDAGGAVGTVTAAATGSDRSVTAADASLFLGEEDVDLTGLDGAAAAGERQRLYGNGGGADGQVATVENALTADVSRGNGFVPGTYALTPGDDTSVLVVERPTVRDVELYPGDTAEGTEVSGSSVPPSVETLSVDPGFNFEAADDATVVVENPDGLDVTDELTADPTVASEDGTVRLDVADLSVGTYTVRVEGADDLDHVNGTATVRIRPEARTVSLSRTRVARGESTVATVSGPPGALRYVRLPADALGDDATVSGPTADAVFPSGEGLALVGADVSAGVVYAEVSLESDGFARVEIDTERLDTGTHDVTVAESVAGDDEASVPVTVVDRDVSVTPARPTLPVGETVRVSGTARGADDVKLYARIGSEYAPLYEDADADELAETSVDDDGSWDVDLDTRAVLTVTDRYRIAAVADPGDDRLGSTDRIAESTLRDFDAVGRATITTTDPSPSASVSQSRVAAGVGDEVTVTGRAPGPGETVRAYVVSPRGAVDARDVAVGDDDGFDVDVDDFGTTGRYRILLVTAGRDATFALDDDGDAEAIRGELTGSETPAQAVAIVRDAYGGAGVDDRVLGLNVTATDPRATVETVRAGDGELVVAGASNRENGTTLVLDLRRGTRTVAVGDAEVNASGRWRTTVDVAGVAPGEYALRVETADAIDVRTVRLGGATPTADPTPASTPTATPTETPAGTPSTATTAASPDGTAAAAGGTRTATAAATRTETTGDGFGPLAALLALLALLALARRRSSSK
jgi:PGF-CTERM protein